MMVFEEKRLRSASVWVIDALKSAATGPLSPRTRRRALKKQRKTVSKLWHYARSGIMERTQVSRGVYCSVDRVLR